MLKINSTQLITLALLTRLCTAAQSPATIVFPNPTPNPPNAAVDSYTRATTKINLKNGFKYGFVSGGASNLLNLNISSYPSYVNNNYYDPSDPSLSVIKNPGLVLGTTEGRLDVSPVGAFSYQLPIVCSPGTAGMQPNISVVYNSNSAYGLLGKGFNLAGISSITRVNKIAFYDGRNLGINYSNNYNNGVNSVEDAFALDSEYLLSASGNYGQSNATYKTEVENYSIITSHASTASGPGYFTVITNDGKILEYGNTADSKLIIGSTKVYIWYINKVTDEFGNYMTFTYTNNNTGEVLIDRIDYTMNSAAGLAGYNQIKFEYMDRSDKRRNYTTGSAYLTTKLLKSITSTNLNNSITQKYAFEYTYNNESLLYSITQMDAQGNELNPTYFEWTKSGIYRSSTNDPFYPGNSITPALAPNATNAGVLLSVAADLNGDGKKDLLTVKNQNVNQALTFDVYRTTATGFSTGPRNDFVQENVAAIPNNVLENSVTTWTLIDVYVFDEDDDGAEEVYISIATSGAKYYIKQIKFNGTTYNVTQDYSGTIPQTIVERSGSYPRGARVPMEVILQTVRSGYLYAKEDVTGDNIKDKIIVDQNGIKIIDPTLGQPLIQTIPQSAIVKTKLADMDGDGVLDLFLLLNNEIDCNNSQNFGLSNDFGVAVYSCNKANSWFDNYSGSPTNIVQLGITIIPINLNSAIPNCKSSDVLSFFSKAADNIDFSDFDGDGRTDVIYNVVASATQKDVYVISTVMLYTPFSSPQKVGTVPIQLNGVDAAFYSQDINTDGLADWVALSHDNASNVQYFTYYPNVGNALIGPAYTFNIFNEFAGTMGDFDGDGTQDFVAQPALTTGVGLVYNIFNQPGVQKIKRIYNIQNDYKIDYGFLASRKAEDGYYLYNKTTSANPAGIKVSNPYLYVVSSTDFNGIVNKYGYENGLFHKTGKGFLGFEKTFVYCQNTNHISVSKQLFDGTKDFVTNSETLNGRANNTPNSFLTILNISGKNTTNFGYTTTGTNRYLSYVETTQKDYLAITKTRKTVIYDNTKAGNVQNITTEFLLWNGNTAIRQEVEYFQYTSITNSFNNLTYYKPLSKEHYMDATVNGSPQSTMLQTDFVFDNLGHLTSKVENSNVTGLALTTSYSNFNSFGSAKTISANAPDLAQPRTSQLVYDNTGRFVTKATNAIGNFEEFVYEPVYGNKIQSKDISGLITNYTYDGLGRLINTTLPNGATNYVKYEWNPYSVPNSGNYFGSKLTSIVEGGGTATTYSDRNGNVLRSEEDGFNGNTIFSEFKYNAVNQIIEGKAPRYQSQTYYKTTTYTYDIYLRPLKTRETINNINTDINYSYNGLANDNTSTQGFVNVAAPTSNVNQTQSIRKINNSAGQVVMVTNYSGVNPAHTITYVYNQFNLPVKATTSFPTASGAVTTFGYDALGRRQTLVDPSAGTSSYQYNSVGEMLQQVTPEGTYNFTYDQIGRMLTKTGVNSGAYSYQYVTAANGRQQLLSITGPNVLTEFKYDNLGRTIEEKETLTTSGNKVLKSNFTYNKYGQLVDHTYPGGFVTTNEYDGLGCLRKIKNGNTVIWQLNGMAAPGLINQFTYNNGQISNNLGYDNNLNLSQINYGNFLQQTYAISPKNGDLLSRTALYQPTNVSNNEQFGYDEFERLTTNKYLDINNVSQNKASVSYMENGNINVKSDAGTYVYAQPPSSPYQLAQINNQVNNISLNSLNITYNSFKKVSQITEANNVFDFAYGNDEERIKMEYKNFGTTMYTRYYGDNYDLQESNAGNKEWSYVYAPTGLCAVYYNNNGTGQLNYVLTDHLGSPVALVNSQQVIEQYSFDAWGRRRDPANWNSYANIASPSYLIRGFTMHEHLDEVGIINMNGRIYDPVLGRFLQTDNYVQSPDNLQNFNRYSYCLNNPLKYTDPSGNIVGVLLWPMGYICNLAGNLISGGADPFRMAAKQTSWSMGIASSALQVPEARILQYRLVLIHLLWALALR